MSNITSISRKVDENSRASQRFLQPKDRNDKRKLFEGIVHDIENAIEQPDVRPSQQAAHGSVAGTMFREEPTIQSPVPSIPSAAREEPNDFKDEGAKRPAKPAGPRMLEKSFSIDKDQYKLLVRYSNMEGLRLETNVSTSVILRHLLDFALAHVDPEKGDVLALRIPERRAV